MSFDYETAQVSACTDSPDVRNISDGPLKSRFDCIALYKLLLKSVARSNGGVGIDMRFTSEMLAITIPVPWTRHRFAISKV